MESAAGQMAVQVENELALERSASEAAALRAEVGRLEATIRTNTAEHAAVLKRSEDKASSLESDARRAERMFQERNRM